MPIYEYHCTACGHQLETIQKVTEEPLKDCPHCGQAALSKLISATSFQLKGSGWYATDFRDKGKAPKKEENKTENSSTDQKTETKKPDEKKNSDTSSSSSTDTAAGKK